MTAFLWHDFGKRMLRITVPALAVLVISGCAGAMKAPPAADAGEDIASLAEKVRVLEAKVAVMDLLGRYSLNIDLGRAEALLALFTDDCVFASDVGGQLMVRRGKEELGEMLASRPPKGQHLQLDYTIRVTGDTATAVGYQELTGLKEKTVSLNRAAYRLVTFRCIDGSWYLHEVYTIGLDNEEGFLEILPEGVL